MNVIEEMQEALRKEFPSAQVVLDKPLQEDGVWALDIVEHFHRVVMWQKDKGFGLCTCDDHGYGEGADEVYLELESALARVIEVLKEKST